MQAATQGGRWALGLVLVACTVVFFFLSWHWPLVGDASLIHYLCFLMDHGMAPYRDTGDMNMPMAFLLEEAAMHAFGPGEVAWRCFDFFVLALAGGAITVIARRRSWFAVVFAGCLFALAHGRDGFAQAGQRDLVLAVNLLAATALLFAAVRHRRPWAAAGFGLLAGVAAAVKPTALPLALVLLALAAVTLRRRGIGARIYLLSALLGGLVGPLASLAFLVRQQAVAAFVAGLRTVVPFYVSLGHRPFGYLLLHSVSPFLPLVLLWAAMLALVRPRIDWERAALLAGAFFGLVSYILQARGFPYYRYTLLAFLLPLMGIDFVAALARGGTAWRTRGARGLAAAGILVGALVIAPQSILAISRFDPGSIDFITSLQDTLQRLGGASLDGNLQCIDSVSGCGTVLYRMRLVQATGVLSDFLLFGSSATPADRPQPPVIEQTRARLAQALRARPPKVIVVTAWLHIDGPGDYRKLQRWPAFADFLAQNYTVVADWKPTRPERWWSRPVWSSGYRVYVRKGEASPNR